jgi:signal transduction histidine kinase
MTHRKHAHIEPGLLYLFRLTYFIWLLLVSGDFVGGLLGLNLLTPRAVMATVNALILLLYLNWDWLQRRFGWLYLPVGLFFASIVPMIVQIINTIWLVNNDLAPEWSSDIFPQLFMLVIIVSAQYGFKAALFFTFGTGLIELLFNALFYTIADISMTPILTGLLVQSVMFIFVAFLVVRLVEGQKEERAMLTQKNIQLTKYATTIERLAISQERNRLARELHDTLAHTLSAVSVQVEALNKQLDRDPNSAKQTVIQLRELTRSGLKESRHALRALRASPLEDLGLALAMQQLIDAMTERSGMTIMLQIKGDFDDLRPEVEQSVYRITEEALNNVNRHAQAKQVDVVLKHKGHGLELIITDDGCGFDPETVSSEGHYGLVGMRERAVLCSGQLSIESQPGKGATVRLKIEVRA